MSRELKFRAWDEKYNCWDESPITCYPYEEFKKQGRTIQWSTGLKDIDNKDIYDGDLVELHTAVNDHAIGVKENHYGLYQIYWDQKYKLKEIKPNWFLKVIDNDCANFNIMKVVGNVFENPELLN